MRNHTHVEDSPTGWRTFDAAIERGVVAGSLSALVIIGLLALAGAVQGVGAATPFYAIVSILSPGALEVSQAARATGDAAPFFQHEFVGGLGICVFLGGVSGAIFSLGTRNHRVAGRALYAVAALHGVILMCFFYLVCLQVVGTLAGNQPEAMSLSNLIGWPWMVGIHIGHGLVLALVISSRLVTDERRIGRKQYS